MNKTKKIVLLKGDQNGFMLIELIAVIIILGVISGIAYGVILLNARTFKTLSDNIVTRWDLRKSMNILREDLQGLDSQKIFGFSHSKNAGKKLFFVNSKGQRIRYLWTNMDFLRREGGGNWDVLLPNMVEPPFQYLDRSMNLTTNKKKIAYIKVHLAVQFGNKKITLEDIFYLRNTAPPAP